MIGPDHEGRDQDPRGQPVEQGAVAGQPADEEDPRAAHRQRQGRVAAGSGAGSARRRTSPPRRSRAPTTRHSTRSGNGVPPSADSRIARTPQVGASSQEIGSTQPGSRATGSRKPQISQTGSSNADAQRPGRPVAHHRHRDQEADHADRHHGGDHGQDEQRRGARWVRRCRTGSGPTAGWPPCCRGRWSPSQGDRQQHDRQPHRRDHEQLEGPGPAFPLDRTARGRADRRTRCPSRWRPRRRTAAPRRRRRRRTSGTRWSRRTAARARRAHRRTPTG